MITKMDFKVSLFILIIQVTLSSAKLYSQFNELVESRPNEYIVKVNPGKNEDFKVKIGSSTYFSALQNTDLDNNEIYLVKTLSDLTPSEVVQRLEHELPLEVSYVTKNYKVQGYKPRFQSVYECSNNTGESPCDSYSLTHDDGWGLIRISQTNTLTSEDSEYTWSASNDGSDVIIYVIDTGVYHTHNEFSNSRAKWGFTGPQLSELENNDDLNGHGTHVAGIAAGDYHGVAKNAQIIGVKVLGEEGSGSLYDVLAGLSYVIHDYTDMYQSTGTRPKAIVNLSLGLNAVLDIMNDALRHGSEMGLIYVVAAGNEYSDACFTSPAASPDAITVGATAKDDTLTWFSNYGACVDILAPGEQITAAGIDHSGHKITYSGTSMAAPFVAGVIARYLSHSNAASDVTCVKQHLMNTAIYGSIDIDKPSTPNVLLYAGCNTCFGSQACVPSYNEDVTLWTLPPLPEGTTNNAPRTMNFSIILLVLSCFIKLFFHL